MDYLSTQEMAQQWGVSLRQVQRLLRAGRIPGARKYGNVWMIPADAKKPTDSYAHANERDSHTRGLPSDIVFDSPRLPKSAPDAYAAALEEPERMFVTACIAQYRGDPSLLEHCYRTMDNNCIYKLVSATLTMTAAMGAGKFALYDEMEAYFNDLLKYETDERRRFVLALPSTVAATSMAVLEMMPDWLKTGDFTAYPPELRPQLVHYYLMYLRSARRYEEMIGVAKTAYSLTFEQDSFSMHDVYYCLLGAFASYRLDDIPTTRDFLTRAIDLALPHGFIVPFTEHLQSYGGILESLLQQKYPEHYKTIVDLWSATWKGWMSFHNRYTHDNVATMLTSQEHHVALLLARGATYEEAANRMHLSTGRIRNIASSIYAKLLIKNKRELKDRIY